MIILDTSFLIDYFRGVPTTKSLIEGENVAVTTITYHEIMTGVKRKKAKREERFFKNFFSNVHILDFDVNAAEESSNIANRLMAIGRNVNAIDILIGGIAVASGIQRVATRDEDFGQIGGIADIEVLNY
ncbi:MAG: type II toxin-antitoxin system VapC family toxin [Archaeoglobaceae archaeon]